MAAFGRQLSSLICRLKISPGNGKAMTPSCRFQAVDNCYFGLLNWRLYTSGHHWQSAVGSIVFYTIRYL